MSLSITAARAVRGNAQTAPYRRTNFLLTSR
jgi:hypothetical protein